MESKDQPDMNVDVPKEEAAATETPVEPEKPKGKPISSLVNQEFVTMIMDMGFTKAVAEKSLLFTNNTSVEGAMEWITQHQDDADFLEEEFLAEDVTDYDPNKPHLSKEERMQRALELQKAAREKRLAEEKKLEEEREKNRIHGTKELLKAKKIMDEQQAKLALEMQKREKMEFIKEKKRMEELLKKEAAERAGKKYVPGEEKPKPKPSIQAVKEGMKIVSTLYTEERKPGVAKACFKTFYTFCKNVVKDPKDDKFRTINLSNEKVKEKIGKISGGLAMLKGVGFYENEEGNLYLADEYLDVDLLQEACEIAEMKFK